MACPREAIQPALRSPQRVAGRVPADLSSRRSQTVMRQYGEKTHDEGHDADRRHGEENFTHPGLRLQRLMVASTIGKIALKVVPPGPDCASILPPWDLAI